METESNRAFERALPSRWVDRKLVPDYGLDYTIEIIDEDRKAGPLSFHAQLKATDEPDVETALASLRVGREWAELYWSLPIPVLMVRYLAADERLYARWFHAYNPHLALGDKGGGPSKTIPFRFSEQDVWTEHTPTGLRAAVAAFMRFRSPALALPLRFVVASENGRDLRIVLALRTLLGPVSDLVVFEPGDLGTHGPSITLGERRSIVALADVASVTFDHDADVRADIATYAANLGAAVALVLTRVGQSNLAAQVARVCAARSTAVLNFDIAMSLGEAFYAARRIGDAIHLATDVLEHHRMDGRLQALAIQMAVLARGDRLSDEERELAVRTSRRTLELTLAEGEPAWAASDAYNLGMALGRSDPRAAVTAFRQAEQLDASYSERAYFNADLAGHLFEAGEFEEAAARYGRAVMLGDPTRLALKGDAELWAGRYRDARASLGEYNANHALPADAVWRLKARALALIEEVGGAVQARQSEAAERLIEPYSLEDGNDFSLAEAEAAYTSALEVDACCAEAWFRLALVRLRQSEGGDPLSAFEHFLASAVLGCHGVNTWVNTILMLRAASLADALARDCLRVAFFFCGSALIDELTGSIADEALLEMLEQITTEREDERRGEGFKLRLALEPGQVSEFDFVVDDGTLRRPAHDTLDRPGGG